MRLERKTVDFRVSILPSVFGESVVIRILDSEAITRVFRIAVGTTRVQCGRSQAFPARSRGLRNGAGDRSTGSGKTTTLYAAITEMNIKEDKLITIEDPVEYQLSGSCKFP